MSVKSSNVTGPSVKPDPRYKSLLVSKFINNLMHDGKKSIAEKIFYTSMNIIARKLKSDDPLKIFEKALENVKPMVEVKSRRVGGANYQVPIQVEPKRQLTLSIRWILAAVRAKKGRPTADKLANELLDAYNREGTAMTTRENIHRMAEANKAFAHFAW